MMRGGKVLGGEKDANIDLYEPVWILVASTLLLMSLSTTWSGRYGREGQNEVTCGKMKLNLKTGRRKSQDYKNRSLGAGVQTTIWTRRIFGIIRMVILPVHIYGRADGVQSH
jgi:hypothetical protein